MDMSYKRAWDLVEELDRIFGAPVVTSKAGGAKGGGAALTALGKKIVILYRQAEKQANVAAKPALRALSKARSGKQK
jgi:molybdate transport system regulatory protein